MHITQMQQAEMLHTGSQMVLFLSLGFAWLICIFTTSEAAPGSNAASANICHRTSHKGLSYDTREIICCGDHIHHGSGLSCCGKHAYNPENATCCKGNIIWGHSEKVSRCCGHTPYNPLNEICCQSTITAKPFPMAQCCGKETYDEEKQLCCGPETKKVPLDRNTSDHRCCGHKQYNLKTECCCWINETHAKVTPRNMSVGCCMVKPSTSGTRSKRDSPEVPGSQNKPSSVKCVLQSPPNCTSPNTSACGTSCYNPNVQRCCERNPGKRNLCSASGKCDPAATVYDPHSQICCDGHVSKRMPWTDQCCGDTPYGSGQLGVLCCNNTLYRDREDGEECSDISIPYNPAKGTECCSQLHGSPGKHCCGTDVYDPDTEICCDGHRHHKTNNTRCCGVHAYDIKDTEMKCCAGTLHKLKAEGYMQCCGSVLQHPTNQVCCRSEDQEVLYSAKDGFECCDHLQYNTTLWSCCAGRLTNPKPNGTKTANELRFQPLNNLNETHLCKEIYVGTVESVSLDSVVFNNVLKIKGENATVEVLPLHVMGIGQRCSFPKLIHGKSYFFDKDTVFTNVNHDSILQMLHYIISKCSL